jgi:HSP20 family protein
MHAGGHPRAGRTGVGAQYGQPNAAADAGTLYFPLFLMQRSFIMANRLTRFDPFTDLARYDPLRGVEDLFREFALRPGMREMAAQPGIRLDVDETEQSYEVKAEMPGLKKEDIKVDIDGKRVSIAAEIKREQEQKEGTTVLRCERYTGQLYRSFTLDQDVDDSQVTAHYEDGVLQLHLPKAQGKATRKIQIS